MSSRLPIGVATRNSVPGMRRKECLLYYQGLTRPAMNVSEPLPHFVDDLLGYLYETHPTHANFDGVHTHDDLLENLSRHGIDSDVHALAGYLRRLENIRMDGLTDTEKLEHRMLGDHLRGRMFELEAV